MPTDTRSSFPKRFDGRSADPRLNPGEKTNNLTGNPMPRISSIFAEVAPTYERVNRVLTRGLDGRWRRVAARIAAGQSRDSSNWRRMAWLPSGTSNLTLDPEKTSFGALSISSWYLPLRMNSTRTSRSVIDLISKDTSFSE